MDGMRCAMPTSRPARHAAGRFSRWRRAMPPCALKPGEAARIFTGAVVPEGADTIVIRGYPRRPGAVTILEARRRAERAQGRLRFRRRGDVAARRDAVRRAGAGCSPPRGWTRCLSGGGRVVLLATGDELAPPGRDPKGPRSSPRPVALVALLDGWGGGGRSRHRPRRRGRNPCEGGGWAQRRDCCSRKAAVGRRSRSLIQLALELLGLTVGFWKIAMRPGKPADVGPDRRHRGRIGPPAIRFRRWSAPCCSMQPLEVGAGEPWRGQRLIERGSARR